MTRPTILKVGGVVYWVLNTYTDSGVLVDADTTPTVAVRKNGASTVDVVTVTKRSATTGIYDCSYNPASEAEGDAFTIEETATISTIAYVNSWSFQVLAAERGTDGANTVVPDAAGTIPTGMALETTSQTILTDTGTTIPALISSLTSQSTASPVERSPNDTNPITFSWPVSGATITAEVSIDNAAYGATTGVVSFLRTEGSLHYYSLAYHAADRPTAEGTSRYKLVDGTYTQYVTLRVEGASTDAAGIRSAVGLASANLDAQLGTIVADTNELQTNQGSWLTATSVTVSDKTGFSIAGTINTLDELDTAQDTQHGTTQDRLGYTLAALAGACADAGTAAETYAITIGIDTYTIDHTELDATGNRGTATLTKS